MDIGHRIRLFFKKVRVDHGSGCWLWTAAVRTWSREPWDGGYPAFWDGDKVVRGHIWLYEQYIGPVPAGKVLLHHCDNRRCVNVFRHIRPGSQLENVSDMISKGRAKLFGTPIRRCE